MSASGAPQTEEGADHPSRYQAFLRHFSRITSGGELVPEIDGLRFLAIGAVVIHHMVAFGGLLASSGQPNFPSFPHQEEVAAWTSRGAGGVPLFFVISGLILGLPFARAALCGARKVQLGAYFKRRLTRLEPPYLLSLLILFVLKLYVWRTTVGVLLPHLVASSLYLHNIIFQGQTPISTVAWSLEVEVQFYCLMPLFGVVYRIRNVALRRALIAGAALLLVGFSSWNPGSVLTQAHLELSLVTYGHFFLAGLLLADWFATWRDNKSSSPTADAVGVVALMGFFVLAGLQRSFLVETSEATLVAVAYYCVFHARLLRWFFTRPTIVVIGGMCYSTYLTHSIVINGVGRFAQRLSSPAAIWGAHLAAAPVAVLVGGALYFRLIERPTMQRDWPRKLIAFAQARLAPAT